MPEIKPFLWFDTQAEEAATFYTSVFPNSRITQVAHYPGRPGAVMTVAFELDGTPFVALNGGPQFTFTEAISLEVELDTQAEVDELWASLIADGGEEGPCGWCKDRFGLSWQIVPKRLMELVTSADEAKAKRAFDAMMTMHKIDLQEIEQAAAAA
jgi:predicted 3-demethylubiquinone-9 3-methyltransferase (glyoxalase superfamily)